MCLSLNICLSVVDCRFRGDPAVHAQEHKVTHLICHILILPKAHAFSLPRDKLWAVLLTLLGSCTARREPTLRSIHPQVQAELDEMDLLAEELARTPLISPRRTLYRPSTPVTPYVRHLATCRALPFMTSSEVRAELMPKIKPQPSFRARSECTLQTAAAPVPVLSSCGS